MISAAIVTFNEGKRLKKCLESIKDFVQEVVVVDLGSVDDTHKICNEFGVKLFEHKFEPYVERVRNFSISKTENNWVLILDPDEEIPSNLKQRLKSIISEDKFVAVNIPRKNIFFGKWVAHSNWWPDRHIRFFKKESVEWNDQIHSYPKVNGEVFSLPSNESLAITHFGYENLSQFLDRQNRYSEIDAQQRYELGKRFSWKSFFWMPTREFLVRFIKHQGFLDGYLGFHLTYFMMVYQLMVQIKLWEKDQK